MAKKYNGNTIANVFKDILNKNNWENGFQFNYGPGFFFLNNVNVKNFPSKKNIHLNFTIEYKTKNHHVINNIIWKYEYDDIMELQTDINSLHFDLVNKTGTKDDVFGERFNKQLFEEKEYSKLGWKILR